ncbi:MAG: immune inhibitor A [Frankiaceae bacterium]|nr:immune inhibitor A [Frankiaceae bacterium]
MFPARRPHRLVAAATAALLVLPVAGVMAAHAKTPAKAAATKKAATAPRAFADFYSPAPYSQVLKQPDGTSFRATLTPGEIGGAFESEGYTVTRGADQVWRYATGRSKAGELLPSRLAVGKAAPRGLAKGAGRTPNAFTDSRGRDIRTETFRQLQIASHKAQVAAAAAGEIRTFRFPVLMLSTWWDAEHGQSAPQFQDKTGNPDYFKKLLDGFGGNPNGTLTEFYFEDSFGQFLVQVDVFGPYTSQRSRQDRCYYGGIEPGDGGTDLDLLDDQLGIGGGGGIGMAAEAVPASDVDVNYSDYDNDGDHVVDFVGIIHSGADMAVTGDPCNTWSHAIQISLDADAGTPLEGQPLGLATNDGVFVDRVFTMPEFNDITHPLTIGVATHEMAHALGEPDYYNTGYTSMGSGDWDIMSGGSYLGNPAGSNPSGFNPASRVFQGWLQPTVVTTDMPAVTLQPRHIKPTDYDVSKPDPNLLLVSLKEIAVGEDDGTGYKWTQKDVYGLAKNPNSGKFVIEGYYLENMSRTVNAAPIHPKMTRSPYFDRQLLGAGIMAWHFDYWLRSNVYFGSNNAQSDANRPQMDVMEWDRNDNTQEQQLSLSRGNAEDLVFGAATGITSGTRLVSPGAPPRLTGIPQPPIPLSGAAIGPTASDSPFAVTNNPNNYLMTVEIKGVGDCKMQLLYKGKPMGGVVDSGFVGDPEIIRVIQPEPGDYIARITDFAGCGPYSGTVKFENSASQMDTKGAADTWSNWSKASTGWAFTNVGPGTFSGLDHSADAGGTEAITLDVIKIGAGESDLSAGFVSGASNAAGGSGSLSAGRSNPMVVPVFNNGGKAVSAAVVQIRSGSVTGPVVATRTVPVPAYGRTEVDFAYTPVREGSVDLFAVVDPAGAVAEKSERNNSQRSTLWAGPTAPRVLVVDDDGMQDGESTYAGALAALGVPYAVVTDHADAATLKQYAAVLWELGGERYQGQLDAADRAALRSYLDGGGKVMVNGPRIADALGENPGRTNPGGSAEGQKFLKQYLGADYVSSAAPNNDDRAAVGKGIFGSSAFEISQLPGRHIVQELGVADYSKPVSDESTAAAIGTPAPAMAWDGAAKDRWLGVSVAGDAAHKGFKTVTLGFNLGQITSADQHVSAVRSVLRFFGVPTGTYIVTTPEPVIYHSAVRNRVSGRSVAVRAVVLGGTAGQPVTLFYRRHGKGGYYSVAMTKGTEKGTYRALIPGGAVTPDGVDYYLKAGANSTYDPPLAGTGTLAHAIGVALPEVPFPVAILPGGPTVAAPPAAEPPAAVPDNLAATGGSTLLALLALVLIGAGVGTRRLLGRRQD